MLLIALQTTPGVSDENGLDALTLVLVVIFIVSMAGLTLLLMRREREEEPQSERSLSQTNAPEPTEIPITQPEPERRTPRRTEHTPVWLQGVTLPGGTGGLTDASAAIEGLLNARRANDLERGLAFCAPAFVDQLGQGLGVDENDLRESLAKATFEGEPPDLQSLELVSSNSSRMSVRAGYSDRTSETYHLVLLEGQWLIEGIEAR